MLDPLVGKIPWRRVRLPTPVFWPGEFHVLYSLWGCKVSDTTGRLLLSLFLFYLVTSSKRYGTQVTMDTAADLGGRAQVEVNMRRILILYHCQIRL